MRITLTTILFLLIAHLASAQDAFTESFSDVRLDKALQELRKSHDLRLAFDGRALRRTRVTADLNGLQAFQGLERLLEGTGYYVVDVGGTLAILPREQNDQGQSTGQTDLTWSARVVDYHSGESLPFAVVVVEGSTHGTSSNEEGFFVLREIPTDTTAIRITYVGYASRTVRLAQFEGGPPQQIRLQQNLSVLPLVAIYGEQTRMVERSDMPGVVSLQAGAIRQLPTPGEPDIIRSIQYMAGISAAGESAGSLHIRGGASDENLIVYDGFTVYHLDHFFGIFSAFNPESVKSMRVHRGWQEARYGGRTSGVVEISGKDGNRVAPAGVFNMNMLSANLQFETPLPYKGAALIVSARRSFTDVLSTGAYQSLFNNLYNATLSGEGGEDVFQEDPPSFYFGDFSMRISTQPTDNDEVNFSLYSGGDKLNFGYGFATTDPTVSRHYEDDASWGNLGLSTTWSHRKAGRYTSTLASYSRYNSDVFAIDRTLVNGSVSDSLLTDEHTELLEWNFKHHLEIPLKLHEIQTGFWLTGQQNRFRSLSTSEQAPTLDENANTFALYTQDRITPFPKLSVTVGARMSYYSGTNTLYSEPRGALAYRPTKHVIIKAAAGRYHQFIRRIRRQDLAFNTPDFWRLADYHTVPVQRSDQFLVGAEWQKGAWSVDGEFYLRQLEGVVLDKALVGLGDAPAQDGAYLIGSSESVGLDLTLERTTGKHTGWLALSFARSDQQFEDLDQGFVPAGFQHATEVNAVYVFRLPKWRFTAAGVYGSGTPYTEVLGTYTVELSGGDTQEVVVFGDINGARLPAYHRLDLSVHYFVGRSQGNIELGFSVFNVYDRLNVSGRNYFLASEAEDAVELGQRDALFLGRVPSFTFRMEF